MGLKVIQRIVFVILHWECVMQMIQWIFRQWQERVKCQAVKKQLLVNGMNLTNEC